MYIIIFNVFHHRITDQTSILIDILEFFLICVTAKHQKTLEGYGEHTRFIQLMIAYSLGLRAT